MSHSCGSSRRRSRLTVMVPAVPAPRTTRRLFGLLISDPLVVRHNHGVTTPGDAEVTMVLPTDSPHGPKVPVQQACWRLGCTHVPSRGARWPWLRPGGRAHRLRRSRVPALMGLAAPGRRRGGRGASGTRVDDTSAGPPWSHGRGSGRRWSDAGRSWSPRPAAADAVAAPPAALVGRGAEPAP